MLTRIAHAADIAEEVNSDPLLPGLLPGLLVSRNRRLQVDADDQLLPDKGLFGYGALLRLVLPGGCILAPARICPVSAGRLRQ